MHRVCVNVKNGALGGGAYNGVPEISNAPRSADYLVTLRLGNGRERIDRPGQQLPAGDDVTQLVGAAHPPRRACRDDDRIGSAGRGRSQSSRGWAKIIRPATVWRTRVTATSRSLSM